MTTETAPRRRPDGSLDTAHYMAKAHIRRSETAYGAAGAVSERSRGPLMALAALIALVPFMGRQG